MTTSSLSGRARRRDEILAAAAGLFADEGYRNTSMREVAAASGILAGSLYHHFPSKEAIAVELVEQYHADLVSVVRDFMPPARPSAGEGAGSTDPVTALRSFALAIAEVSVRNRAARQLSMYDAPTAASSSLKTVIRAEPPSVDRQWSALVSAAVTAGAIDPRVDGRILRDVLRATMPQVAVMTWEQEEPSGEPAAAADCTTTILFDGLASAGAALPEADGTSAAIRAVSEARERWTAEAEGRLRERRGVILDTARAQFALRGFDATTVRDIADAAGIPAGNLYRYFESKDAMITAILSEFSDRLLGAYEAVLEAGGSAVESLEAICWLLNQAGRHFSPEIDMLKGNGRVLSLAVASHYRVGARSRYAMLVDLIDRGVATGELRGIAAPALVAACVREVMWAPMRAMAPIAPARVREFIRHTILVGAARPHCG